MAATASTDTIAKTVASLRASDRSRTEDDKRGRGCLFLFVLLVGALLTWLVIHHLVAVPSI
ncbi:MAG: hypothetical protein PVJ07_01530, partial [Anaerolineales bacterium]